MVGLHAGAHGGVAGWIWAALVAAMILVPKRSVHAQALEPRSYANSPVEINFVLLAYGYTEGDVAFDASAPITDAKVHVHAGLLAYARSLDLWGLSDKVLAVLPVAEVSGSAKVKAHEHDRQVFGLADPLLRMSVNFFGAPRSRWKTSRRTSRTSSSGPACR